MNHVQEVYCMQECQYLLSFYEDHSVNVGLRMPKIPAGLRKFSHYPYKVFSLHRNTFLKSSYP